MTPKRDYTTESIRLAKAADIAIAAFKKYSPTDWPQDQITHFITCYSDWKENALNPEPQFRKLASLKYTHENIFTFFQESNGKIVDYFWDNIKSQNLGFVREDRLFKILKRGKIRGRIEYEYITDLIVAVQQEGRTTKEETEKLGKMLADYEKGKQ